MVLRPLLQSIISTCFFFFFLLVLLVNGLASSAASDAASISYHDGPILTGEVKLSLLWYGPYNAESKAPILNFIESLNNVQNVSFIPSVAQWWDKVESYQSLATKTQNHQHNHQSPPEIKVSVVKQVDDPSYSQGKQLSSSNYQQLAKNAAVGTPPGTVAVVIADKQVAVEDVCKGPHYIHGVNGDHLYIVVADPGDKCPRETWLSPYESENEFISMTPPNGDPEIDSKIIHLAAALAGTVTNPYSNAFYGKKNGKGGDGKEKQAEAVAVAPIREIATVCEGVFGSGSFPGYTGRLRVDPATGANFNAHGIKLSRFMLPAIWDMDTSKCWTLI